MNRDPRALRFEVPLYTVAEASFLLGVPHSTFRTWTGKYWRQSTAYSTRYPRKLVESFEVPARRPSIPFIGLVEGFVLAAFRRAGVPLIRIRPAIGALQRAFPDLEHVLASRRLFTDGANVLYDFANNGGVEDLAAHLRELVIVVNGQRVFGGVVEQYLRRISWGDDGYPLRLSLLNYGGADVVADPNFSFGQPIFASSGVRVSDVLDRIQAGENLDTVADDFATPVEEVAKVYQHATLSRSAHNLR